MKEQLKDLFWVGSSKKELASLPDDVVDIFGYALHCFQKKSKQGIKTPKPNLNMIKERLKAAKVHAEGENND